MNFYILPFVEMCLKNQQYYLAVKNGNYSFLFL